MRIERIVDVRCRLGEGPLWDEEEQALYWVDALDALLFRHELASGAVRRWQLPTPNVGSLAIRAGGGAILAMDRGFHAFDLESGEATPIAEVLAGVADVRFNDGKTDRQGRFLAGSMDLIGGRPIGTLFRLDPDLGCTVLDTGFICVNGPCLSPDGRTLYCTGRRFDLIEAYEYDPEAGAVANRRPFFTAPFECDGATVDADGCLWSAQWAGGCVLRITPNGRLDRKVEVPGHVVSSVMFGGPGLDLLFVTTLGEGRGYSMPTAPDAGCLLCIHGLGTTGLPEPRFAG